MFNYTDVKGYKLFESIVDTIKQKEWKIWCEKIIGIKPNTNNTKK